MKKKLIGMIHLGYLPGQDKFESEEKLIEKAKNDLIILQENGFDAAIIENWEDQTQGEFVKQEDKEFIKKICLELKKITKIELGINTLPNDYKSAFEIANQVNLQFIQMDVLVDHVKTNFTHSKQEPFEIKVDLENFLEYRKKFQNIKVLASVHPKHYHTISNYSIIESSQKTLNLDVDYIVVTGDFTGLQPNLEEVNLLNQEFGEEKIIIGSGVNKENINILLSKTAGAIVGTYIKDDNFENILPQKVKELSEIRNNI